MNSVGQRLSLVLIVIACYCGQITQAGASKEPAKSTGTQTDPPACSIMSCIMDLVNEMSVAELLRPLGILVVALAILFWDRREQTWINFAIVAVGFPGLCCYFGPAQVASNVVSSKAIFSCP